MSHTAEELAAMGMRNILERQALEQRIAFLLEYSMEDVNWEFEKLSRQEQKIVCGQSHLDIIKRWAEERR